MKVLVLSVDFAPHRDGVSTLSFHYARRMLEQGHCVSVVGPAAAGANALDERIGFRAYRFRGYGFGLFRWFPFAVASVRAIRRERPQCILCMNVAYGGLLVWIFRGLVRAPFVSFAYAYEFRKFERNPLMRWIYRRIYAASTCVVAISAYTREALVGFGVDSAQIETVYPGVDPLLLRAGERNVKSDGCDTKGPFVIGTCGRLIARKGHADVIRAMAQMPELAEGLEYRIAGAGPEKQALLDLADSLGLAERIVFLGSVSQEALSRFFGELDVFVMPSLDDEESGHVEGFGIVYLEAAAFGVPSLATRTGGIPEAVLDGETGILVEGGDVPSLEGALRTLLQDPDLRKRLGQTAKTRALGEFSWDLQVDHFCALLAARMDTA